MLDQLLERNLLPDPLIRFGIRRLLSTRLREEARAAGEDPRGHDQRFAEELRLLPIAINTEESRRQHYEVPTSFYQQVLGPRLKYSCCWYETGEETLAEAEETMLDLYVQRARLCDGQQVLELGCGWGSLTLYLAERFPGSQITGVSHSAGQRAHILAEARRRGLNNLTIITCDMNAFHGKSEAYDRVVSVEMFEHMKNWPLLIERVQAWLKPGGLFFLHIFTHQRFSYHFVARDESDWMSRHFFTGGMMPSDDLVTRCNGSLRLDERWRVNGRHYQQTAEHWLENMDANKATLLPLLAATYGKEQMQRWWAYWRIFLMSCAELWGYRRGEEWLVSHYCFSKPTTPTSGSR